MAAEPGGSSGSAERKGRHRALLRSTLVTSGLTVLSRIVGLVREQVRGYYLGTGTESDAFGIAATIPNMLRRLFAEGAMTAAFVPVFTGLRADADPGRVQQFYRGFMTLFVLLMAGVTMLGILASGPLVEFLFAGRFHEVPGKVELTVGLTRVMFPYLFLVSIAAIIQATLNSFHVFGPSAFSPVLLSVANIATVVFFHSWFPNPAWALAVGFLAGGVLQLAFQVPFLRKQGITFRPTMAGIRDPAVWQVARILLPGVFSAGIYQINVTISQVIAAHLDPGSVASLQYSLRLQELVLGVFAVSVATVLLPTLSEQVHRQQWSDVKETFGFSVNLLAFVTFPATVGLILLGTPIVRVLFQYGRFDDTSTAMTVFALQFHAAGIFFVALQRNVVQVFYAMHDLRTPTWVAAVVMLFHGVLCLGLSGPLRQGGIALAGSVAAALNVAMLWWLLRRRIGRMGIRAILAGLGRTSAATLVMGLVVWAVDRVGFLEGVRGWALAARLLPVILTAIAVYIVASRTLGSPELDEFLGILRRRFRRGDRGG
ncbi:murein biosynthesis integral membrane protein MurJ [Myxococcota bacterium]|nr:murein biosynthesis integral membrane protein MurJ [Myxococcota bacterium]